MLFEAEIYGIFLGLLTKSFGFKKINDVKISSQKKIAPK